MPTDTSDQQITMPVDADTADNPVGFVNMVADVEPRLVRLYTNEADRTARMLTLAENQVSGLAAEKRLDVYDGSNHISLYARSLFALGRSSVDQNLTLSSTGLQNVTNVLAAMPTAGTFGFRAFVWYSSSTTADIKLAFSVPAAATIRWTGVGMVTGTSTSGDVNFTTPTASDATAAYGANGVGSIIGMQLEGTYVAGGTAGNLQLRAAQNAVDATQSVIHAHTRLEVWRSV